MRSLFLHSFGCVIVLIISPLYPSLSPSLSLPSTLPFLSLSSLTPPPPPLSLSPLYSFLPRLRTLSSGNSSNSSGGANAVPPSPTKLPLSSSSTSASKKLHFKMAEHRYGKEELLQLFCEDPTRPPDMPTLFPITRDNTHTPLAFMPLSEDEQVRRYYAVTIYVSVDRWNLDQ